jgi:uncharacterized membrane protein YhiD involved in acid resistance
MIRNTKHQRGISLFGLLFFGFILAFVGIVTAQVLPPLNEYLSIKKHINTVKSQGTTVQEIRQKFDATAYAQDIKTLEGKDLDITKENDKIKIKFAYNKEVPVMGPVSLLIKFAGQSD